MIGVITEPDERVAHPGRPAVILLNAGLLHRIGPHRIYVNMARELARIGFFTLRVDLCGVGDSAPRADALPFAEGAVVDVRRAMDHLAQQHGVDSFILGGLCSGADNTFHTAVVDERVTGMILLDWYAYRTGLFYVHHYGPRLFRVGPWKNKLVRVLRKLGLGLEAHHLHGSDVDPYAREFPPKEIVAQQLDTILQRGVHGLFIYTGGQSAFYNYRSQFRHMFRRVDFRKQVRSEFFEQSDHTFTLVQNQKHLRNTIVDWIHRVNWINDVARLPTRPDGTPA